MAHLALKSAPPSASDQVENIIANARTANPIFIALFILSSPRKVVRFLYPTPSIRKGTFLAR
jgi:hypothetical protein